MKISHARIDRADIRAGDTILQSWKAGGTTHYLEFVVEDETSIESSGHDIFHLIDRPKEVFPEEYGTLIIAKKVRGQEFPEGVVLARQRGSNYAVYSHAQVMWKSLGQKICGADNHSERQIEDWVLAKAVPA
jgi:hypothetical protein